MSGQYDAVRGKGLSRTSRVYERDISRERIESIKGSTLGLDVIRVDADREHHVCSVMLRTAMSLSATEDYPHT